MILLNNLTDTEYKKTRFTWKYSMDDFRYFSDVFKPLCENRFGLTSRQYSLESGLKQKIAIEKKEVISQL